MKKMLISSTESYSGKSGIAISLLMILSERGYNVGYFKPIGLNIIRLQEEICDEDAYFIKKDLGIEVSCPILLDRPYIDFAISEDPLKLKKEIMDAFSRMKKDVVIIEGSQDYQTGASLGICDVELSKMLDSKVLMVAKFSSDFVIDRIVIAKKLFNERLHHVILNQVSGYKKSYIKTLAENFKKLDLEILGMIPKDISLMSLKVSEIAKAIDGEFLVKPEKDEDVEKLIVGLIRSESASSQLGQAENYALVVSGDRNDIINIAIQSGAKCVIATGNLEPSSMVLALAERKRVPVILSKLDTATTMMRIQEKFGRIRIRGEKIKRMKKLLEENMDVDRLLRDFGL
uniref:Phosphotransacetylase family protein n=1 Tax=Archaeoglobus fulgidus TaxID=2234 RepID=A0A7J2TIA9_ARCFL